MNLQALASGRRIFYCTASSTSLWSKPGLLSSHMERICINTFLPRDFSWVSFSVNSARSPSPTLTSYPLHQHTHAGRQDLHTHTSAAQLDGRPATFSFWHFACNLRFIDSEVFPFNLSLFNNPIDANFYLPLPGARSSGAESDTAPPPVHLSTCRGTP